MYLRVDLYTYNGRDEDTPYEAQINEYRRGSPAYFTTFK